MHYHEYEIKEKQAHDELCKLWPLYVETVKREFPNDWLFVLSTDRKLLVGMPNHQKLAHLMSWVRFYSEFPDPLWYRIKAFFTRRASRSPGPAPPAPLPPTP